MAFTDHKISAFTHKISDLADQPNLPPDELKARFDACPEQLRVSLNAVCDEAAALDTRVDGIITGSFTGAVAESMLAPELIDKLNAKADQTAVEAETASRQSADSALSTRVSKLESSVPQKARIVYGTYTGDGTENRFVSLGFRPRLVIISQATSMLYYGMFTDMASMIDGTRTVISSYPVHLEANGFRVSQSEYNALSVSNNLNQSGRQYGYVAIGT
nr:hypothetical protein [uncultured Agathobaculum sp.]